MTASVTAILGMDTKFYDKLPQLFAHAPARDWFVGNEKLSGETAFRNSTLQGGYFIIAARSLGLDCGPMSGFSKEGIDKTFFAGTSFTANFLCNLGYGDNASLFPRGARLAFEESCRVV
jgi:3-hydroxypropanoate dehydrogenase